jgi:hypothetical protein
MLLLKAAALKNCRVWVLSYAVQFVYNAVDPCINQNGDPAWSDELMPRQNNPTKVRVSSTRFGKRLNSQG